MHGIFVKIAFIVKTILAALGVGGCLNPKDVDLLDDVVDIVEEIEEEVEDILDK